MKKFFGILFLLIGLFMIGLGLVALTHVATMNDTIEGQFGSTFSSDYQQQNNQQQIAGFGLLGGGIVFFIIGIVMISSKSNSQRIKEAELSVLKNLQKENLSNQRVYNEKPSVKNENPKNEMDKYAQIEKLGKLKEKGLLTEEEFQKQKISILNKY